MTYPLMDALYSAIFRLSIEELSHLEGKRHGNIRDLISTRQELIRRIVASVANSEFHEHCLLAMDESPRPGSACAIAAASTASTDDPSEVDPARKTFRDQAKTVLAATGGFYQSHRADRTARMLSQEKVVQRVIADIETLAVEHGNLDGAKLADGLVERLRSERKGRRTRSQSGNNRIEDAATTSGNLRNVARRGKCDPRYNSDSSLFLHTEPGPPRLRLPPPRQRTFDIDKGGERGGGGKDNKLSISSKKISTKSSDPSSQASSGASPLSSSGLEKRKHAKSRKKSAFQAVNSSGSSSNANSRPFSPEVIIRNSPKADDSPSKKRNSFTNDSPLSGKGQAEGVNLDVSTVFGNESSSCGRGPAARSEKIEKSAQFQSISTYLLLKKAARRYKEARGENNWQFKQKMQLMRQFHCQFT